MSAGRAGERTQAPRTHVQLNQGDTNLPANAGGECRRLASAAAAASISLVASRRPLWASAVEQPGGFMRRYALVSGTFLAIIAVAHLIRAAMRWPIVIADVSLPVWCSLAAFVVTGGLALWGFREAGRT